MEVTWSYIQRKIKTPNNVISEWENEINSLSFFQQNGKQNKPKEIRWKELVKRKAENRELEKRRMMTLYI